MKAVSIVAAAVVVFTAAAASAQTAQESNSPGVTTEIAYVRQYNGALHVGVRFRNTTNRASPSAPAIHLSKVTVVESGRKHFPLKDAAGHYIGGPISDWNEGGRWFA